MPSAVAFLALGDVIAGALFQSGAFTRATTVYVWGILAGSAVGLLASTLGRLYASTYYALQDTRTPLRFAILRVALTIALGYLFALPLPGRSASIRGGARRGSRRPPGSRAGSSSCCCGGRSTAGSGAPGSRSRSSPGSGERAVAAAAAAWALGLVAAAEHPDRRGGVVLSLYGALYFAAHATGSACPRRRRWCGGSGRREPRAGAPG